MNSLILLLILINIAIIIASPLTFLKNFNVIQYSNINRIVGGSPALSGEYPGIVSIQTIFGDHYCGGTIITDNFVLTAAHCIIYNGHLLNELQYIQIVADDLRNDLSSLNKNRQIRYVSKLTPHPNFSELTNANDIGLMKVSVSFVITTTFYPIYTAHRTPYDNEICSVAGWGRTQFEGETSAILLKVDINIINMETCNLDYFGIIPEKMVCAGDKAGGKDSCQGDSGSALICNNELSGIVSFGYNCALPNYPGVYTDVSYYNDWINNEIILETSSTTNTPTTIPLCTSTPEIDTRPTPPIAVSKPPTITPPTVAP